MDYESNYDGAVDFFDGIHCPDCGAALTDADASGMRDCPRCAFCTTTPKPDETSAD